MKLFISFIFTLLALGCAVQYSSADTAAIKDKNDLENRFENSETDVKTDETLAKNKDNQLEEGGEEQNSVLKLESDNAEKEFRKPGFRANRHKRNRRSNKKRKNRKQLKNRRQHQRKHNKNRRNRKNRKNGQNRQNRKNRQNHKNNS